MIIISNGFNKFHMAVAAAELDRHGRLAQFLTGAYPKEWMRPWLQKPFFKTRKISRFLDRRENIPEGLISSLWLSEALHDFRMVCRRRPLLNRLDPLCNRLSFRWYARQAKKIIARSSRARIYHYRAGFGHESVVVARRSGMVALCDHSIAHPAVLQYLVDHQGRLPANGQKGPMDRLWQDILADIEQSDHVLVNSDFVKETFVHQGWAPERVHVIYLGVDAAFLDAIPSRVNGAGREKNGVRLLFGGCFERRKGAEVLIQALLQLDDLPWRLEIAGPIADDIQRQYHSFLKDSRVEHKGLLSRKKLAEWMAEGGIFVFPSLAEGSARVVFEALACGCYPITTPNSGSIVEDGVHGRLIPAGDVEALAEAIRKALGDRGQLVEIGRRNAALVHTSYRQSDYGEKLITLYDRLVQK